MDSTFTLSQGAGQKLEFAVQRNGGTAADIEWLSAGNNFAAVTRLRTGAAVLVAEVGGGGRTVSEPTRPWTIDSEGNIHFTLRPTNGMTREQWEEHFERRGGLTDWERNVLRCASEAPTDGVAYHIVVRPGKLIADSDDRTTKKIRAHAATKGWKAPYWEVAPLIRDSFTYEQLAQMGLWYIAIMHEPITPYVFDARRRGAGRWLPANHDFPDAYWLGDGGFAFEVPRVSS